MSENEPINNTESDSQEDRVVVSIDVDKLIESNGNLPASISVGLKPVGEEPGPKVLDLSLRDIMVELFTFDQDGGYDGWSEDEYEEDEEEGFDEEEDWYENAYKRAVIFALIKARDEKYGFNPRM